MRQWFLPPGKTFISPLASSKHPVKENNFTYLEQGDLQMTAYTCSPSKPRWLCIGAGILFYIQKQKWTLSRLHGFEGKHRRYHGSGETEQWMGVISRRVALKSNLSSSDTAHTSRLWHALSLTGRPKNAYELGVSANNSHMLHRSWLLAHLTLNPGHRRNWVSFYAPAFLAQIQRWVQVCRQHMRATQRCQSSVASSVQCYLETQKGRLFRERWAVIIFPLMKMPALPSGDNLLRHSEAFICTVWGVSKKTTPASKDNGDKTTHCTILKPRTLILKIK